MEKHLGRKLVKGEVIHHEDGDITNNNIENLRLFENNIKHMDYHRSTGSVSGTPSETPTYIKRILELKKNGKSIRAIASIVGEKRSNVHRWLKKYNVPFSGSGASQLATKFEIHDYQVSFNILERPRGWSPNAILKFRKQEFKVIERNGWEEFYFKYNDCSVHITPHKILIFPPKIQSKVSIIDAKTMATQIALEVADKLENHLEIKISSKALTFITIAREHAVLLNDKVWDMLKKAGFEKVRDDKGKVRLMLDESDGKHIESNHPQEAAPDIEKFNNLIKETIIEGSSFYKTNKALVTTQQALLSIHERITKIEQERPVQDIEKSDIENPSYIG